MHAKAPRASRAGIFACVAASFLFLCRATGQALFAASASCAGSATIARDWRATSPPAPASADPSAALRWHCAIRAAPPGGQIPVAGASSTTAKSLFECDHRNIPPMVKAYFAFFRLAPGDYSLRVQVDGYAPFGARNKITLHANEVLTLEISARCTTIRRNRVRVCRACRSSVRRFQSKPWRPRLAIANFAIAWTPIPTTY